MLRGRRLFGSWGWFFLWGCCWFFLRSCWSRVCGWRSGFACHRCKAWGLGKRTFWGLCSGLASLLRTKGPSSRSRISTLKLGLLLWTRCLPFGLTGSAPGLLCWKGETGH